MGPGEHLILCPPLKIRGGGGDVYPPPPIDAHALRWKSNKQEFSQKISDPLPKLQITFNKLFKVFFFQRDKYPFHYLLFVTYYM